MRKRLILSALIGLTGAVWNNGKTENTDLLVMEALLLPEEADLDEKDMVEKIHGEKYVISPNCATCQFPCGNTSDYDVSKWDALTPELLEAKGRLYTVIVDKAKALRDQGRTELPQVLYKAISYLGYDLELNTYREMMEEIQNDEAGY